MGVTSRFTIITNRLVHKLITKSLGVICCSLVTSLTLLTFPFTYMFRWMVTVLAKTFRSDLGNTLNGQSAILVGDYMAETTPRSNIVMVMMFRGQLTIEEIRTLVVKNWISVKSFEKFQQYPANWLGFSFWRKIPEAFNVTEYVHKYSGKHVRVSDEELNQFVETLLNRRSPNCKSPWEMHLIENFKSSEDEYNGLGSTESNSVLIMKWHHCLVDGTGVVAALVEGLFQQRWTRKEPTPPPELSPFQTFVRMLVFPFNVFSDLSYIFSHTFIENIFKISDSKKEWHQVYALSGKIPNKVIKGIKNAFGVSYTSVLLSAISSAVHKTQMQESKSTLFLSVLPAEKVSKRQLLSNHWTGTTVDVPNTCFKDSIERVRKINEIFEESRWSHMPFVLQYLTTLCGSQFLWINKFFSKNRTVPIILTNIAGVQDSIKVNGGNAEWTHTRMVVGAQSGNCGILIAAISHGQNTELHITAEQALMTRQQAQHFLYNVKQEIEALGVLRAENLDVNKESFYWI